MCEEAETAQMSQGLLTIHRTYACDGDAMHRRRRHSLCTHSSAAAFSTLFFLGIVSCSCFCSNAFAPVVCTPRRNNGRIIALQARDGGRYIEENGEGGSGCLQFCFRTGKPTDQPIIAKTMVLELMNPLGLDPKRFRIAETRDGKLIGWGQIKPLGLAIYDPSKYNSSPGSGSMGDIMDEDIWLEFEEDDSVEFPNGVSSFPWSPAYQKAAEAAKRRREKRATMVGKERMVTPQIFELSSIYVVPPFRSQGVGKSIVRDLLHQHMQLGRDVSQIYALTLRKTLKFYHPLGFQEVEKEDIPSQLKLEIVVGRIITKVLGEELVCLRASRAM